ncbi:hypothetical protein CWB99_20240 [Pseudoalteromonas rubra]|uniref:DUF1697 domain-containing protein n=1 Tax=Pseudoalteromonas rubra TaxID=43658 RepID=A0A5S3WGI0_9GAMM|nr:DUF1697 domain-containing protein [Pseudoalteromonas rubra]TMP25945.1 hypothetical protein CWB99_20240 [Pseudoalteromonas rubra]TMP29798.1 hypothetical protein CWC00_18230 [Pseudoalteromonas rubra]
MKYVCLMRGINVSGQRKVNMKTLCTQLAELGMDNVSYYLQSGNLLFDTSLTSSEIKATITQLLGDAYDYQDVDLFLFTFDTLQAIYDEMPTFVSDQDVSKSHFTFLNDIPDTKLTEQMDDQAFLPDQYRLCGTMVYVYCPNGYGRTKIHTNFFERKLKVRATTRNHKTVATLLDKLSS